MNAILFYNILIEHLRKHLLLGRVVDFNRWFDFSYFSLEHLLINLLLLTVHHQGLLFLHALLAQKRALVLHWNVKLQFIRILIFLGGGPPMLVIDYL